MNRTNAVKRTENEIINIEFNITEKKKKNVTIMKVQKKDEVPFQTSEIRAISASASVCVGFISYQTSEHNLFLPRLLFVVDLGCLLRSTNKSDEATLRRCNVVIYVMIRKN